MKPSRPERTFSTYREAQSLPGPERGQSPWEYPHVELNRIKLRVHPPNGKGEVRRQLAIRAKSVATREEDRSTYLEFAELARLDAKEARSRFVTAIGRATERLAEIDGLRKATPEQLAKANEAANRMTVGDAWARHGPATQTQRDKTDEKEIGQYKRYLSHLADSYLDELDADFWEEFIAGMRAGRRINADRMTWTSLGKGKASATMVGVINLAAKLYSFAHKRQGSLRGRPDEWNPALEVKKKAGKPNKRTGAIPLHKIAEAWRASDILCSSWARDHFRLYLLTGLRFGLLSTLTFAEVDVTRRELHISPHKPGTKRRGEDTPENAPDLEIPISATAFRIIERRRSLAPDPNGPVWYSVSQPGGNPGKAPKRIATHSDPRTNWAHISERVLGGMHFMRHDLRRTFARLARKAGADMQGTSLLMLHSPRTVAQALDIPGITYDYMRNPKAKAEMRSAADSIEKLLQGLLDGSVVISPDEDEPELPPLLEQAVGLEDE